MTPLNSIKRYWIGFLAFVLISVAGCSSSNNGCPGCTDKSFAPNVGLRLTDSTKQNELFFGSNAKYTLNDIVIKHVENGKVDSLPAPVKVDLDKHVFNVSLLYKNDVDTLSIQLGTLKPKLLYVGTGILDNCCAKVYVSNVHLESTLIFSAPEDPKKQALLDNVITVPVPL
jgi:hypothetical protein